MDRIKFSPMADLLVLLVVKVPEIQAEITRTYPEGSYERKAFEKLHAFVPDMDHLAYRLVEADNFSVELTAEESQRLQEVTVAIRNTEAIMQEAGIAIEFTALPSDFRGFEKPR